jgi:hypothetical protein
MSARKKQPQITPGYYQATFVKLSIYITDDLDLRTELWFRLDDCHSVAWSFDSIPFLDEPLPTSLARLLNESEAVSDLKDFLGRKYFVRVEPSWSGKEAVVTRVNLQNTN